jgi:hypothetical protein
VPQEGSLVEVTLEGPAQNMHKILFVTYKPLCKPENQFSVFVWVINCFRWPEVQKRIN